MALVAGGRHLQLLKATSTASADHVERKTTQGDPLLTKKSPRPPKTPARCSQDHHKRIHEGSRRVQNAYNRFQDFLETAHNPHGDYAPASTALQGILKNMYDTFTNNLMDGNNEEVFFEK